MTINSCFKLKDNSRWLVNIVAKVAKKVKSYCKLKYISMFEVNKVQYKIFNAKIILDLTKDVDRILYLYGFESENLKYFKKTIKKDDVVFDVGANIGIYSLVASKTIGQNGKVYSFEPADRAHSCLLKNIEINKFKNIVPIKKGVSNYSGNATFNVCDDDAYNSLGNEPMRKIIKTEKISVVTIDDFVKENNIKKVDVIKVDTEGAEYLVFKGADKTLRKHKPVLLFEYNRSVVKGYSNSLGDLTDLIKSLDYALYEFINGNLVMVKNNSKIMGYNLIAIAK